MIKNKALEYISLIYIILLILLLSMVYTLYWDATGFSQEINFAGRQRMLIERYARLVIQENHDSKHLETLKNVLISTNSALATGGNIYTDLNDLSSTVKIKHPESELVSQSALLSQNKITELFIATDRFQLVKNKRDHDEERLLFEENVRNAFYQADNLANILISLAEKKQQQELFWMLTGTIIAFLVALLLAGISIKSRKELLQERTKAQQQAENLLRSEETVRSILETVVDGIITINKSGNIASFNKAAEKIFGYQAEEVLGHNVNILMPEPYHKEHDQYIKNYTEGGSPKIIGIGREVIGLHKDGSTFAMDLAVGEFRTDKAKMFTGIVRDISERNKFIDQLKMQGTALKAAANAIIITDGDGNIEWANPAFSKLTGYTNNEIIGENTRILKSGVESASFYQSMWETITQGNTWQGELTNRCKDNTHYVEEQTITPLQDTSGNIIRYIAVKQDISERKATLRALEEQKCTIELNALYESTQAQVMTLFSSSYDAKHIVKSMLPLLAESHHYHISAFYLYDEWEGKLLCTANYGLEVDYCQPFSTGVGIVGQVAADQKTIIINAEKEKPFAIEAGITKLIPKTIVASPVIFSEKLLGVIIIGSAHELPPKDTDFIERLCDQIGVSLNNLNQYQDLKALSGQLKQRTLEIGQKNNALEKANRLKTEFLANMSHELRTPLNAIIGFSEILKDNLLGDLNKEQSNYVKEIFSSAHHLLSLINDILDLSKIEAGKMELFFDELNITELLQNSLSVVKEQALAHRVHLKLEIEQELEILFADGRKLKQILYNLLSNAVKFTPDGGDVTVRAEADTGQLMVSVTDTGIGISEEDIGKLFHPFEQLDGSLSRKFEGTGLGLTLCKRFVELHGGQINITSTPGKGSCFSFTIPYRTQTSCTPGTQQLLSSDEQDRRQDGNADIKPVLVKQPLVLFIEDNKHAAELMRFQLENEGYRTLHAVNGKQGLSHIKEHQPDLIILDIILPDIDGWEVMRQLKQLPECSTIPVIVVSIVADDHRGLELGAIDVLEKPVNKHLFLGAIQQILPYTEDSRFSVLIVDDDEDAVESLTHQFKAQGFSTLQAYGGEAAINLAKTHHPDLLILDLMMPEVTGFDVTAALRAEPDTADIPIIILTAKTLTDEDRNLLQQKVSAVVEKSEFNAEKFLQDVRKALKPMPNTSKARSSQDNFHTISEYGDKQHILVIEDNKEESKLLTLNLEGAGFQVTSAPNGVIGIELMKQTKPDIIALDLLMPEMDGFTFLELKSRMVDYQHIPVLVLSSIADQVDNSMESVSAVLSKPVRRKDLLTTLNSLLGSRGKEHLLKVLVIDDDANAIEVLHSYLEGEIKEFVSTMDSCEAYNLTAMEKPDIIILDLMMPVVNGFEVLEKLKADSDTKNIPVIILTSKILNQSERQYLQNQVAAIAEKSNINRAAIVNEIKHISERIHIT